jgi:exodeoxyribonuclease III
VKIATWNINSVRLRFPLVEEFLKQEKPDILCLQEIKCREAEFPSSQFRKIGYPHICINGQKGYHGVAIISRIPLRDPIITEFGGNADARYISASVETTSLRIHNFYVPAGGDIPDPEQNPKFAHKLSFLDDMNSWSKTIIKEFPQSILVGDLNIAPHEHDVWSHKALLNIVSHTPIEVEKLLKIQKSGKWFDAGRFGTDLNDKLYTWWSYRSPNWEASDRGRRLDHIWTTTELEKAVKKISTLKPIRNWERPSDHVPIVAQLKL